ncbi:MAG TPA: hypothetical protein VGI32_04415 [Steroidobacteraceae bacterium]|jgi:catechol 2,3-dioxygenase-like lactoylglutathione lyase family enzyme
MIFGAHVVLYSKDAAADRAFFRDVLGLKSIDAGHGWLIFACRRRKRHSTPPMGTALTNSFSCAMT